MVRENSQFINQIDAEFCCMVCGEVPIGIDSSCAVLSEQHAADLHCGLLEYKECGHYLCSLCYKQLTRKACPLCRKLNTILYSMGTNRKIRNLPIHCDNFPLCSWVGSFSLLSAHKLSCSLEKVKCPNKGCTVSMPRNMITPHEYACEHRIVSCEKCGLKYNFRNQVNHVEQECLEEYISCGTCNMVMQRKFMQSHETDCPKRIVACEYTGTLVLLHYCKRNVNPFCSIEYGCEWQGVMETFKYHIAKCPFAKLVPKLISLQKEAEAFKQQNETKQLLVDQMYNAWTRYSCILSEETSTLHLALVLFCNNEIQKSCSLLTLVRSDKIATFIKKCIYRYFMLDLPKQHYTYEELKESTSAERFELLKQLEQTFHNVHLQTCIGLCYFDGGFMPQNLVKSHEYFSMAANRDHPVAQYFLGLQLFNGMGVAQDKETGYNLIVKSANQGFWTAEQTLGDIISNGLHGGPPNEQIGVQWWKKAAQAGFTTAQHRLGKYLFSKNAKQEAVKLYTLAAEQMYGIAEYDLAWCMYNGVGIERDLKRAAQLFKRAEDHGIGNATLMLGLCFKKGYGTEQNHSKAFKKFEQALTKVDPSYLPEVNYQLGLCHLHGEGCIKSKKEAKSYFKKAPQHKEAQQALLKISNSFFLAMT